MPIWAPDDTAVSTRAKAHLECEACGDLGAISSGALNEFECKAAIMKHIAEKHNKKRTK